MNDNHRFGPAFEAVQEQPKEFVKGKNADFQTKIARVVNMSGIDAYSNTPDWELAHTIGMIVDAVAEVKFKKKNQRDTVISRLKDELQKNDRDLKVLGKTAEAYGEKDKANRMEIDALNLKVGQLRKIVGERGIANQTIQSELQDKKDCLAKALTTINQLRQKAEQVAKSNEMLYNHSYVHQEIIDLKEEKAAQLKTINMLRHQVGDKQRLIDTYSEEKNEFQKGLNIRRDQNALLNEANKVLVKESMAPTFKILMYMKGEFHEVSSETVFEKLKDCYPLADQAKKSFPKAIRMIIETKENEIKVHHLDEKF